MAKVKYAIREFTPNQNQTGMSHSGRFVGGVARCRFCFNWWLSWAVVIPAAVVTGEWWLLLVPFFSTTVGRLLSQ